MNKKLLALAGLILLAVGLIFFLVDRGDLQLTSAPAESDQPTVHVAANLPLSGPLATYGAAVREGATMALSELSQNETPFEVSFDWEDNGSEPRTAVTVFQKQILEPIDIYVSGVKPQTMAILDQVSSRGIPHFVWIFDAFINEESENNLRTWVSYKIEPPVYFSYAEKIGAERVAIVYVQLPHTVEEFEEIVVPGLEDRGMEAVLVEPFDYGTKDFKNIASKVKASDPDLIILNGFQAELVGLVRALRPLGLIRDGNTIATYDMLDAANVLGPDELEGLRLVAPRFATRPEATTIAEWKERFRARYGKEPLYTHAFAYDMVSIIFDAASRLELPASEAEWLAALRDTSIPGVTGQLSFDEDGDLITPLEVGVYRDGELVPESDAP